MGKLYHIPNSLTSGHWFVNRIMAIIHDMFTRILILTLVIGLGLMACAAVEQPMNPDLAQAIVANAWQADQHIVWELDWPAAPVGGPLTVEIWRTNEGYRYEILESVAPALVGETLVFNGQKAWQYNRFSTEGPVVPGVPWLSPVSDAFAMIDSLIATPPQTVTQESVQIIHGPAQKITLTFDNGDYLILWCDEETQLPVKIVFSTDGKEVTLNARDFEPLVDLPQGLFELENR
jgi:hypothetical protein